MCYICLDNLRTLRSNICFDCCHGAPVHRACAQRHVLAGGGVFCPLCRTPVSGAQCMQILHRIPEYVVREAVEAALRGAIERRVQERRELLWHQATFT